MAQSIRRKGFVDDEAHGRFPEPKTVEAPEKTCDSLMIKTYMGVSENSVPLNPMVNDHYPVFKWL